MRLLVPFSVMTERAFRDVGFAAGVRFEGRLA